MKSLNVQVFREAAIELREILRDDPEAFEPAISSMSEAELLEVERTWQWYARPKQLRPEGCRPIWLRQCGRGEGKTRSAAEELLDFAEDWGADFHGMLCSKTIADVRDVMINGESGLVACARRRGYEVRYIANQGCVFFPHGGRAYVCSSEKPDKPRGYQTNYVWCDEIAAWRNPIETFDNILYGWRLSPGGTRPTMIVTTTPKPNAIMLRFHTDEKFKEKVTVVYGSTHDNRDNLSAESVDFFLAVFDGTTKGLQETEGQLIASKGATTSIEVIERHRVNAPPELSRVVVGLDPSIDDEEDSDEAGIIVAGIDNQHWAHGYLLDDFSVGQADFTVWAERATLAAILWDAEKIIAEINQGGKGGILPALRAAMNEWSRRLETLESLLAWSPNPPAQLVDAIGCEVVIPVETVWATDSKEVRAEPVGSLYERGRIHHCGVFPRLEKELSTWMRGMPSPNRMDAAVYCFSHLIIGDRDLCGPLGQAYG